MLGSISQSIKQQIKISGMLKTTYLTDSRFVFDLMGQVSSSTDNITINTANALLNMELPF